MIDSDDLAATELAHLARRVSDHSSVLQAVQADLSHMVKAIDRLVTVADKQTELAVKMAAHGDALDRAFKGIDGLDSRLATAVRDMTEAFKAERKDAKDAVDKHIERAAAIHDTVVGYRAGLRLMLAASGVVTAGLFTLVGIAYSQLTAADSVMASKIEASGRAIEQNKEERNKSLEDHATRILTLELDRRRPDGGAP